MTRALTLSAVAAMAFAGSAAAQNLSVNPGFETGDFTGWTDFLSPDASIQNDTPNSGSFYARIDNQNDAGAAAIMKNANVGIGQVNGGDEVEVRFFARGSAGVGGVHFAELFSELSGGGVSKTEILGGAPLFPSSPTAWQEYVFTTTVGPDVSGGLTLQFNAATGAVGGSFSTLDVDDVSITVIPEPSSLALLGLGGLAVVRRRRRA